MSRILNRLSDVQRERGSQGRGYLRVRRGRSIHEDRTRIADRLGLGTTEVREFLAIAKGCQNWEPAAPDLHEPGMESSGLGWVSVRGRRIAHLLPFNFLQQCVERNL